MWVWKAFHFSDNCAHAHATPDPSPDVFHQGWVLHHGAARLFMWPSAQCYPQILLLSKGPFGMVENDPKQTQL